MKPILILTIVVVLYVNKVYSKVYTKCGLTKELANRKFDRSLIGNWVCMIESESGKDTAKVVSKGDGSKNLGLFQINSKEWCQYKIKGGKCNLKCEDLIDEYLDDDALCAKKVYNAKGFQNWDGWKRSCYMRNLPLPKC